MEPAGKTGRELQDHRPFSGHYGVGLVRAEIYAKGAGRVLRHFIEPFLRRRRKRAGVGVSCLYGERPEAEVPVDDAEPVMLSVPDDKLDALLVAFDELLYQGGPGGPVVFRVDERVFELIYRIYSPRAP